MWCLLIQKIDIFLVCCREFSHDKSWDCNVQTEKLCVSLVVPVVIMLQMFRLPSNWFSSHRCLEVFQHFIIDWPSHQTYFFISTFLFSNTEFEDFLVTPPLIFFSSGSRSGDISCTDAFILSDDIAEPLEDFSVNIVSQNEEVAVVNNSVLTVFIEDDDGMGTCSLNLRFACCFLFFIS